MKLDMSIRPSQTDRGPADHGEVLALLISQPPDTGDQTFVRAQWPQAEPAQIAVEVSSQQKAWLFWGDFQATRTVSFEFGPTQDIMPKTADDVFQLFDNRYTTADDTLRHSIDRMKTDQADLTQCERSLVDFIWSRFEYGPRNPALTHPKHFDDVVVGNCIDINTYLLSALYCAKIESSYLAGYHFSDNTPGDLAHGMHCWITSRINGQTFNWDIAHCLIKGLPCAQEGLNPTGGSRAAFSYGRGLVYETPWGLSQQISHFAKPHWLMRDMSVHEADITVQLTQAQASPPLSTPPLHPGHSTAPHHPQFGKQGDP